MVESFGRETRIFSSRIISPTARAVFCTLVDAPPRPSPTSQHAHNIVTMSGPVDEAPRSQSLPTGGSGPPVETRVEVSTSSSDESEEGYLTDRADAEQDFPSPRSLLRSIAGSAHMIVHEALSDEQVLRLLTRFCAETETTEILVILLLIMRSRPILLRVAWERKIFESMLGNRESVLGKHQTGLEELTGEDFSGSEEKGKTEEKAGGDRGDRGDAGGGGVLRELFDYALVGTMLVEKGRIPKKMLPEILDIADYVQGWKGLV